MNFSQYNEGERFYSLAPGSQNFPGPISVINFQIN